MHARASCMCVWPCAMYMWHTAMRVWAYAYALVGEAHRQLTSMARAYAHAHAHAACACACSCTCACTCGADLVEEVINILLLVERGRA